MWKSLLSLTVVTNLLMLISSNPPEQLNNAIISSSSTVNINATESKELSSIKSTSATPENTLVVIETHHMKDKCASNEKYEKCPNKLCQPQTCEQVGTSMCLTHIGKKSYQKVRNISSESETDSTCHGPPACVCIENYVRDDKGVCIPMKECDSCGNDKNATVGCGINCGRRCSNYNKKDIVCVDVCYENSCDCKQNYLFDDYTGNCVLPEDCSNKKTFYPADNKDQSYNEAQNHNKDHDKHNSCQHCNINNKHTHERHDNKIKDREEDKNGYSNGDINEDKNDTKEEKGDICKQEEDKCDEDDDDSNEDEYKRTITDSGNPDSLEEFNYSSEELNPTSEESKRKKSSWKLNKITETTDFHATTKLQSTNDSSEEEWTNNKKSKHKKPTTVWGTTTTFRINKTKPTSIKPTTTHEYITRNTTSACTRKKHRTTTTKSSEEESFETTKDGKIDHYTSTVTHSPGAIIFKKCEGRHEKYYPCVPSCPEYTCNDLVQHKANLCHLKHNFTNCKPGCRCYLGHYRDDNGHCVSGLKCKKT